MNPKPQTSYHIHTRKLGPEYWQLFRPPHYSLAHGTPSTPFSAVALGSLGCSELSASEASAAAVSVEIAT